MSNAAGQKRPISGDVGDLSLPPEIDLSDEQVKQLEEVQKYVEYAELSIELDHLRKMVPVFAKRRDILKSIPSFWPIAFSHHPVLQMYSMHAGDKDALSHLEDIWVDRNEAEPRAYRVEFHFKENPYFNDKVLIKDFKYVAPANLDSTVQPDGLTAAQKDFDMDRDIQAQKISIDWKSDTKNLVQLYPRKSDAEEDDEVQDHGSFFNWFTEETDNMIGPAILDVFDDAIDLFYNRGGDDEDVTDSESENEEEDDEEIDLEKPKKRARNA